MSTKIEVINNQQFNVDYNVKEKFCKNRLFDKDANQKIHEKCYKFYSENIKQKFVGYKNCPYGYTCVFSRKNIISSLIIEDTSNLKLIKGHNKFLKQKKINIDNKETLKNICLLNETEQLYQIRSNVFHDLKNSNYYIHDLLDIINEKYCLNYRINGYILDYFKVFEEYEIESLEIINKYITLNEDKNRLMFFKSKIDLYDKALKKIERIVKKIILNENNMLNSIEQSLYDFFNLVDYRIRYFKRVTSIEDQSNNLLETKEINLHKIITKLVNMLEKTASNKRVSIKFNYDNTTNYDIRAVDDMFLILFILLENSIKYALFESYISIVLHHDNIENRIYILISNKSKPIGVDDPNILLEKGMQGDNANNGSGLGLYMVNEMLVKQNMSFNLKFVNNIFQCEIGYNL